MGLVSPPFQKILPKHGFFRLRWGFPLEFCDFPKNSSTKPGLDSAIIVPIFESWFILIRLQNVRLENLNWSFSTNYVDFVIYKNDL